MTHDPMYKWRQWTPDQRESALDVRKEYHYPKHSPPHPEDPGRFRIVSGTCYEHAHILDTPARLASFECQLLEHLESQRITCAAWVVLPNHYHILVKIENMKVFSHKQGRLHGRNSFMWNREDNQVGRQVWYRCQDRCMRDDAHYMTTLNYIHNNPVKHGYVDRWGDWPYSSFHLYLKTHGREWLEKIWRAYPVLDYGDKWDV